MTVVPQEPDWNTIIDEILKEMEDPEDDRPIGLDEYFFSKHSRDIHDLEAFDWNDEWIRDRPGLLEWLQARYEEWWEDQLYENDGFQDWLNGYEIRVRGDAYIDDLQKILIPLYKKRIMETHKCSICDKEISEKHPRGHDQRLIRLGHPDPEVHPDGYPDGVPADEIKWKMVLYCEPCWRRDILKQ